MVGGGRGDTWNSGITAVSAQGQPHPGTPSPQLCGKQRSPSAGKRMSSRWRREGMSLATGTCDAPRERGLARRDLAVPGPSRPPTCLTPGLGHGTVWPHGERFQPGLPLPWEPLHRGGPATAPGAAQPGAECCTDSTNPQRLTLRGSAEQRRATPAARPRPFLLPGLG